MKPLSLFLLLTSLGCAGVQRVPLKAETARLPDGRFNGPLELVATASVSGGPLRLRVDASGWISDPDQERLTAFLLGYRDAQLALYASGRQLGPDLNRCAFFRARNAANVPSDCQSR